MQDSAKPVHTMVICEDRHNHNYACAEGTRTEPSVARITMESKRKAVSPCESDKLKTNRIFSPKTPDFVEACSLNSSIESSFVSSESFTEMPNDEMDVGHVETVSYTIDKKDGEKFKGAIDRPAAKLIWERGLNLPGELISGIALNQSLERSFMIDYDLKEMLPWDECPTTYEVVLNGSKYEGAKFVPKPKPPELGEEVLVKVTKTRFKLRPHHVTKWLEHFGRITKRPEYDAAPDLPSVTSDDISLMIILRKHIPGILPAYGRRMTIRYPGQPILCSKCFELGHIRRNCEHQEPVKWASFVKVVGEERFVSKEMLGDWAELLETNN